MDYQVYSDGGSFEASSAYQRLLIEFFGLSAILCDIQMISMPKFFYQRLHTMFEFSLSLLDKNGNTPLFGDNDSGTLLQYEYSKNEDYSYLKSLYSLLYKQGNIELSAYELHPFLN